MLTCSPSFGFVLPVVLTRSTPTDTRLGLAAVTIESPRNVVQADGGLLRARGLRPEFSGDRDHRDQGDHPGHPLPNCPQAQGVLLRGEAGRQPGRDLAGD